jgi:hypothetical protein
MSITISFGLDGPLDWDAADLRKLEDAVDVLRRRCGLEVDRPVERHHLQRALGDLEPVLYGVAAPAMPEASPIATPR